MADFNTYKDAFPHAKLTRSPEGVLEVVLHTNGGTLIFNGYTHEEFADLFHQISQDPGNRVVILTGSVQRRRVRAVSCRGSTSDEPRAF